MDLRPALLGLLLAGCNQSGLPLDLGTRADRSMALDGTISQAWPRRVVLSQRLPATGGDYVYDYLRLADGLVAGAPGDLNVFTARSIGFDGHSAMALCEKGPHASLASVPVDTADCPLSLDNAWHRFALFGETSPHTTEQSRSAGWSMLVRSGDGGPVYRLRIVGDSYDASVLTSVTFDYEPVP